MLMIICDKCKKPAGLNSYVLTTEVIHNPVPMSPHDKGSASLNVETQYKMCLCDECYHKLGFPNPYEVKETGEVNFTDSSVIETTEEAPVAETPVVEASAVDTFVTNDTEVSVIETPTSEPVLVSEEQSPIPEGNDFLENNMESALDNVEFCMMEEPQKPTEAPTIEAVSQLKWVITHKGSDGVKYYKGYNKATGEVALTDNINEAYVFNDSEKAIQRAISLNKTGKDFTVAPYTKGSKNEEN